MNGKLKNRRGPLLWLADRSRRFWVGIGLLAALYVISSGPARLMAGRRQPIFQPVKNDPGRLAPSAIAFDVTESDWWLTLYFPLVSTIEQGWGIPLEWYVGLFPPRDPGPRTAE